MNTEQESKVNKHSPLTYMIYGELQNHIGQENAIKAEELAAKFGISKRCLRHYISEIRTSTEIEKVVTSTNDGYFICTAKDEFHRTNRRLYSMAFSLLKAARSNEKKAGLNGQGKLNDIMTEFADFFEAFGKND